MLYNIVKEQINHLLKDSNKKSLKIQISFSGGMDSSCLLDILQKIKKNINVELFISYVNYHTSDYSNKVENHLIKSFPLKNIFIKSSIFFECSNFESKARKIRYNFLNEIKNANNIDYTFTAHHLDDQFETILMKFIDGSDEITKQGVRKKYNKIYRPFLSVSKSEIKKYCTKNNILFFKDLTNEDMKFRRNKIRKVLIPQLKNDIFILEKINNLNQKSLKEVNYQKNVATELIQKLVIEKRFGYDLVFIKNEDLTDKSILFLKILFKKILSKYYKDDNLFKKESFWLSLFKFLQNSKVGSSFSLNRAIKISKDRTCIIIYNEAFSLIKIENKIKLQFNNILINGKIITKKKYSKKTKMNEFIINKNIFNKGVYARTWKYGDKVSSEIGSKKVSDLFIDFKIPRIKKKSYLILENNCGEIIWIPGIYSRNYPNSVDSYKIIYTE